MAFLDQRSRAIPAVLGIAFPSIRYFERSAYRLSDSPLLATVRYASGDRKGWPAFSDGFRIAHRATSNRYRIGRDCGARVSTPRSKIAFAADPRIGKPEVKHAPQRPDESVQNVRGGIDEIFFDPEIFFLVLDTSSKSTPPSAMGLRQRDKCLLGGALILPIRYEHALAKEGKLPAPVRGPNTRVP
jgi:hypothetical protein